MTYAEEEDLKCSIIKLSENMDFTFVDISILYVCFFINSFSCLYLLLSLDLLLQLLIFMLECLANLFSTLSF